jgi:hypothetical protein
MRQRALLVVAAVVVCVLGTGMGGCSSAPGVAAAAGGSAAAASASGAPASAETASTAAVPPVAAVPAAAMPRGARSAMPSASAMPRGDGPATLRASATPGGAGTATPSNAATAAPASAASTAPPDAPSKPLNRALIAQGYRPTIYRGQQLYCRYEKLTGSQFTHKVCLTEQDAALQERLAQDEMNRRKLQGKCLPPQCNN